MNRLARPGFVALALLLAWLSLPPGPLPWLVLVADAPLAGLLLHRGGRGWKRWTLLLGFAHHLLALAWLGRIHPAQPLGAAAALAPTTLLLGLYVRIGLRGRLPLWLVLGSGVVGEELLRTVWLGGMPLPSRALAFAGSDLGPGLAQAVGGLGAYVLVFSAGAASGVAARVPQALARGRAGLRPLLVQTGFATAGVLLACLPGWLAGPARTPADLVAATEDVLLVQAAIPQALKHSADPAAVRGMFDRHVEISAAAYRAAGSAGFCAVLWPETMIPWPFLSPDLAARFPRAWDNEVGVLRRIRADVPEGRDDEWLLGAIHHRGPGPYPTVHEYPSRDSLFHVRPRHAPAMDDPLPRPGPPPGAPAVREWRPPWHGPEPRHDKVCLVPFGEYTPLGDLLPPLRWVRARLSASIPELEPGEPDQVPFRLHCGPQWTDGPRPPETQELRVGTAICYDLLYPAAVRRWRAAGAQILLNPANYGWFGPTAFRAQIRAVARLRAAETGMAVAMAGNTGPTAFFDPTGAMHGAFFGLATRGTDQDPPPPAGGPAGTDPTTYREGWVVGRPRWLSGAPPPYVLVGDLPWLALLLAVLGLSLRRFRTPGPPGGGGGQTTTAGRNLKSVDSPPPI